MANSSQKGILALYIVLVFVILPLMSPLRALGVMEPALVRNMALPPLLMIFILLFGVIYLIKPRAYIHLVLAVAMLFAMIVGAFKLDTLDDLRPYFSHGFQILSAYVMVGVGWKLFDQLSSQFWRILVYISIAAAIISSFVTIRALGAGDIGRFYTPAYGFILTISYGLISSNKVSLVSFFGGVVSNKRGVIASLIAITAAHLLRSARSNRISKRSVIKQSLIGLTMVLFATSGSVALINWADSPENRESGLGRAVNISYDRLKSTLSPPADVSLNRVSAGRIEEIQTAYASLKGLDYIFGNGAGWQVQLIDGKEVQNIHFTPLSLAAVYGAPLAILLYLMLGVLVFKGLLRSNEIALTITERMAPLYLCGALIHSLVAYSLFIDWMVFFFVGVLTRSLKNRNTVRLKANG